MYMKRGLIIIGLLLFTCSGNAQTQEIDRLYHKYKDKSDIIIYSAFGEIAAHVSIDNNVDNKPYAITISGRTNNTDALSEIVYNLIKNKKKQGFKHYSGNNIEDPVLDFKSAKLVIGSEAIKCQLSELEFVRWNGTIDPYMKVAEFKTIYKKGTLYFHVHIIRNKYNAPMDPFQLTPYGETSFDRIQFEIVNQDNNRKGGANAQILDF